MDQFDKSNLTYKKYLSCYYESYIKRNSPVGKLLFD